METGFFKFFQIGSLFDVFQAQFRIGYVTSIQEYRNFCTVAFNNVTASVEAYYGTVLAGGRLLSGDVTKNWGIFSSPSINSIVLVLTIQNRSIILLTLPTGLFPEGGFENWRKDGKLNVNRLPIAKADKRIDEVSTNSNEDLVKHGELFFRSSGLADILLDYLGNILFDTHKQFTIRIGNRNATTNKISSPEMQIDVGRIVDSSGNLTSNRIKISMPNTRAVITVNSSGDINITDGNSNTFVMDSRSVRINRNLEVLR